MCEVDVVEDGGAVGVGEGEVAELDVAGDGAGRELGGVAST